MHPSDSIPFPKHVPKQFFYKVNGMEEVHRRGQTRSKSSLSDDMPRDNVQGKISVGKRLTTDSIKLLFKGQSKQRHTSSFSLVFLNELTICVTNLIFQNNDKW